VHEDHETYRCRSVVCIEIVVLEIDRRRWVCDRGVDEISGRDRQEKTVTGKKTWLLFSFLWLLKFSSDNIFIYDTHFWNCHFWVALINHTSPLPSMLKIWNDPSQMHRWSRWPAYRREWRVRTKQPCKDISHAHAWWSLSHGAVKQLSSSPPWKCIRRNTSSRSGHDCAVPTTIDNGGVDGTIVAVAVMCRCC